MFITDKNKSPNVGKTKNNKIKIINAALSKVSPTEATTTYWVNLTGVLEMKLCIKKLIKINIPKKNNET